MYDHADFERNPEKYKLFKTATICNDLSDNGENDIKAGDTVVITFAGIVRNQVYKRTEPIYNLSTGDTVYATNLTNFRTLKVPEMKFSIQRFQLRAMLHFSAKKDIRQYINGLCVTQSERGTVIDSTNGHICGRLRIRAEPMPLAQVIINRDDVEKLKGTKKQGQEWVHFTVEDKKITCIANEATMIFTTVDGIFPNIDNVTPKNFPDEQKPSHFNPEYVMAFALASEEFSGKKQVPHIYQRGEDPALVTLGCEPEFIGVLMPMRAAQVSTCGSPAWIHEPLERIKDAA